MLILWILSLRDLSSGFIRNNFGEFHLQEKIYFITFVKTNLNNDEKNFNDCFCCSDAGKL